MKISPIALDRFLITLTIAVLTSGATGVGKVIPLGAGSYLDPLPEGAKGPPRKIYKTDAVRGAMPTNDWWSSLAWVPLSDNMYPHPLAMRAVEGGLRIWYPGAAIVATNAAIMGGGGEDLVLGLSTLDNFQEARVAGWSDWFVTAEMGDPQRSIKFTFGHGSPFVFVEYSGGEPVVRLGKSAQASAGGEGAATIIVRVGGKVYGLFAPTGSKWTGIGTDRLLAKTNGKSYFSVALLPDGEAATLEAFRKAAHHHVKGSRVAWFYDEKTAAVKTTFEFTTHAFEGEGNGTIFALYPHQWRRAEADFTGQTYASVRGPMKVATGTKFTTVAVLPGLLPSLPLTTSVDRSQLRELLATDLAGNPQLTGDTYWLGKQLGKWATMLPLAEQVGDTGAVAECDRRLRLAIEAFLSASDTAGSGKTTGCFAYDPLWGTLIGYPASFGSDDQLNDHHFHYGYFFRAAGELARRDSGWAEKWGAMLKLLARDVASADPDDPLFPFLRCFDPYAGHSWASGHAKFGDGNNNESSSEAVNAWFGLILLGEATGDKAMRDLGAWLYTMEVVAIEDYWFDVRDDLHPVDYSPSVVTMIWGGKGANGTWFSANPEAVHGINFLPITGGSLYLGRWPEYAVRNYRALVKENLDADIATAMRKRIPSPTHDGTGFDQWADLMWMYRALSDPADAQRMWLARPVEFKVEAGNSLAQTYCWITVLGDLGQIGRAVSADTPFAAVFDKGDKRSYVAWNLGASGRTVTFSDRCLLECAPRALSVSSRMLQSFKPSGR